jgi:uncharacterized protein (TIGR02145 family)
MTACPAGWRLPTLIEFANLVNIEYTDESQFEPYELGLATGKYTTVSYVLTFPAGLKITSMIEGYTDQSIFFHGSNGYWLSTEWSADTYYAWRFGYASNSPTGNFLHNPKSMDRYVRCVRNP